MSRICRVGQLKRWRDQLHLLAPSDAALIREHDKMIEHMARIVADQGWSALPKEDACVVARPMSSPASPSIAELTC